MSLHITRLTHTLKSAVRAVPRAIAAALDGLVFLASLGAIWYGVKYADTAWWIVGALIYAALILNLFRSWRSEKDEPVR
jgi:TRAP-type C4-dicarboxylate transport system permease small subunit